MSSERTSGNAPLITNERVVFRSLNAVLISISATTFGATVSKILETVN